MPFKMIFKNRSEKKWPSSRHKTLLHHLPSLWKREKQRMILRGWAKNTKNSERAKRFLLSKSARPQRYHHLKFPSRYIHPLIGTNMTRSEKHRECLKNSRIVKTISYYILARSNNSTVKTLQCQKKQWVESLEKSYSKRKTPLNPWIIKTKWWVHLMKSLLRCLWSSGHFSAKIQTKRISYSGFKGTTRYNSWSLLKWRISWRSTTFQQRNWRRR